MDKNVNVGPQAGEENTDHVEQTGQPSSGQDVSANRRHLLKMAAAGMPMVLTMRASAQSTLISQLQCTFTVGNTQTILVDSTGAAWVGTGTIRYTSEGLNAQDIENFQANSISFTSGTVPQEFRPAACPIGDDDDDKKKDKDKDDDDYVDCGFNVFVIDGSTTIRPSDFLSGTTWTTGGTREGLYVDLTRQLVQAGGTGGWSGVSCMSSILIYLGQA